MSSNHLELEQQLKWANSTRLQNTVVTLEPLVLEIESPTNSRDSPKLKLPKDLGIKVQLPPELDPTMSTDLALLKHEDYTVGWICALPTELAAARAMFDRQHKHLPARHNDNNTYVLGEVGEHNVVIACLPSHSTGTVSAATVAQQMLGTFESIRFGLMVGIGGGVPSVGIPDVKKSEELDIRLGDVVVSDPNDNFGGVIQYRFGKTVDENKFIRTGTLNKPPAVLRTAVSKLKADHDMEEDGLPTYIAEVAAKFPKMEKKYSYQGVENDRLFKFDYDHVTGGDDTCDYCEELNEVQRQPRESTRPVVFYGLIASDNNLVRHGGSREKLRRELGVMCVEMEAAGLLDEFPCLVIRGICDYADTHKNKRWQPYAAATAAAYAKELLLNIPEAQVSHTEKAAEVTEKRLFQLSSLNSKINELDLNDRDDYGRSPLHIASQMQDEKLVKEYVQRMTREEIGLVDVGQFTALHLSRGHEGVVRALVSKMRPQDFGLINCYQYTVLDEAVMNWPDGMIDVLLEYMLPKDIDRQNISGWTSLHQASDHGRKLTIGPLLKKMTRRAIWAKTTSPGRQTALHMTVRKGYQEIAEALINVGDEDQITITDESRRTALHIAAEEGHVEIVEMLLNKMHNDDVWSCDSMGNTALHKATLNSQKEILRLLLRHATNADDVMQENDLAQSALDIAKARKDRRIGRLLEEQRDTLGRSETEN